MSESTVLCDTSTGVARPVVPKEPFSNLCITTEHLGYPAPLDCSLCLAKADAQKWTRTCLQCQKSKVQCHTITPLSTFATPGARFDRVHIDLVGPLPPSEGFRYLLTCIDRFTRWPEPIPITTITAEAIKQAFVQGRFGVPSTITTDRGHQFETALWAQLTRLLGSQRIHTTAYHLIANGLIECLHHQLKAALKLTQLLRVG